MSQLPSDLPQLPKWPFLCADAVLLGTATLIASFSKDPTQGWPLISVVSCVVIACALCAIPFLTDYARSQDQLLDERQRALEGLAKSVSGSAEQISIAVQGLSRLDEQLQRHLRQIDQVPQKINERLGDLQQRLATTREGEIEELERELAALKASEGDRLESVMDQLQRATVELSRLEKSAAHHAEQSRLHGVAFQSAAGEYLTRLDAASSEASARLTASLELSLTRSSEVMSASLAAARTEIDALFVEARRRVSLEWDARSAKSQSLLDKVSLASEQQSSQLAQVALSTGQRLEALDKATLAATQRFDELDRLSSLSSQSLDAFALRLEQRLEQLAQGIGKASDDLLSQVSATQAAQASFTAQATLAAQALTLVPARLAAAAQASEAAPLAVTPEQGVTALKAELPVEIPPSSEAPASLPLISVVSDVAEVLPPPALVAVQESAQPVEKVSEPQKAPVAAERPSRKSVSNKKIQPAVSPAPVEAETSVSVPAPLSAPVSAPAPVPESPESPLAGDASKGRQPRKKPEPVPAGMVLDLFNENFSLEDHHDEPLVSRAVSADGATRIIVTAYIGIGNKLFIRGDGPGLNWERGQALQFVSIGKWRWESLEAESSFRFKLYKNDQLECATLGEQCIDAGQQTELTANF